MVDVGALRGEVEQLRQRLTVWQDKLGDEKEHAGHAEHMVLRLRAQLANAEERLEVEPLAGKFGLLGRHPPSNVCTLLALSGHSQSRKY